ncbi:MAG: flagellar hook-associated protein FlgK [Vicinamibacterales bacterium]
MSNLFTSLTSATRALEAQRFGLDVAGQNIANVNTPGYARRAVDLVSSKPDSPFNVGRGAEVAGVRSLRDQLLDARLGREVTAQRREAAVAEALSVVEASLGEAGSSIDAALVGFFDAFGPLAENPASAVARQDVLLRGASLASAFGDMSSRFEMARTDADRHVRGAVAEINALAERIASLNGAIGAAATAEASLHLRDDLSVALRQLSELTDADMLVRADGGADVSIGPGQPLVVGGAAYAVAVESTAPSGLAALTLGGTPLAGTIEGGRLGGLMHVRDTLIPGYQQDLDTLAFEVAAQVNAAHEAGFDLDGAAGEPFFTFNAPLAGVSGGAAAALQVTDTLAADGRLIAAAGTPTPGDNTAARALAALREARVLDGGSATLVDGWAQLVYVVGRDVRTAEGARDSRAEIVRQVDALRDEVSGVSLDEEAMMLMKFQRAYEANAKFFTVIDQAIQTLLNAMAR